MCLNSTNCSTRDHTQGVCTCGGKGNSEVGGLHIRRAVATDVRTLVSLVGELAAYENLGHEFDATSALFNEHFFGAQPKAHAILAHTGGDLAGFAVWYPTYSTFAGTPGAFLEDLYVRPPFRKHGIGKALLVAAARDAALLGCSRLEWRALKWNDTALKFYDSLGAKRLSEWTTLRLEGTALSKLPEPITV
jgi:GNAT superfamily N-acetyltransferase